MSPTPFLLAACIFNLAILASGLGEKSFSTASGGESSLIPQEDGQHRVEIDGSSAIMRRSIPSPHHSDASASYAEYAGTQETSALGTMILLVNSEDKAEMKDLEETFVPSILNFLQVRTPITVLYSGHKRPVDDATFKLSLNPNVALSLVDVTLRVQQFAQEHATQQAQETKPGKNWKLTEFWTMHVHLLPELQRFHYMWRLSPKSTLTNVVTSNLFQVMHDKHAVFGYRLLRNKHLEACSGLQQVATDFFKENSAFAPQTLHGQASLAIFEQAQCPTWTPDFQLVDLDYLRNNNAYANYIKYIANKGGFAKHGWGEHSVQTLFLASQNHPDKMLCMTPWVPGYQGESGTSCGAGLSLNSFAQQAMKDSFAKFKEIKAQAELEVKEVKVAPEPAAEPPARDPAELSESSLKAILDFKRHQRYGKLSHIVPRSSIIRSLSVIALVAVLAGGGFAYKKKWDSGAEVPPLM